MGQFRGRQKAIHQARRFRRWALATALVASLVWPPSLSPLAAQGPLPPPPGLNGNAANELGAIDPLLLKKLSKPGGITLKSTTLPEALTSISANWGVNIVMGDEIQGQVSGVFQDAPLHEILDAILLSNGYSYRPVGQTLVVMKLKDLGDNNPLFETVTIPIQFAKPDDILNGVKILASPQGKLQTIGSARMLLVTDFPDHVARIRAFAKRLDEAAGANGGGPGGADGSGGKMEVLNFHPQFVEAKFLKESVTAILSKEGKCAVMDLDNRVVVYDYPSQLKKIYEALLQMDVPRTQVRITAYIYDLNLQDVENLGVNWSNAFKGRHDVAGAPQTQFAVDSITQAAVAAGATNGALTFVNLSHNVDLTAVVQALQTCNNSRLLADPNVSVYDGETASFSSVTEIPYQQLTETAQGGNIGTTAFREAGVKLQVIPRIADDGTIRMECNPSFSRLSGYTPDANPEPIIDRREAKTTVRVANGQTFVIGGLRTRTDVRNNTGVPGLKDIPWLGWLFRSHSTTTTETELIVFIKPEIIQVDYQGNAREHCAEATARCGLDYVPRAQGCNCNGEPPLPIGPQGEAIHCQNPGPMDGHLEQLPPPVPNEAKQPAAAPEIRPPTVSLGAPANASSANPSFSQDNSADRTTASPVHSSAAATPRSGGINWSSSLANQRGFEALPALSQITPREGSPGRAGASAPAIRTASRPPSAGFEALPPLDSTSRPGPYR
ncbi:MAG TPA: hypothetical protein VFE24_14845 [Pirellulales bacterium]|jgi:general secretion pathway protein D|nr:hypothetical protein [Pirellulales bacterium]